MAKVTNPQTDYQEMPESPPGTGRSSIELYYSGLQFIQGLRAIVNTDKIARHTFMSFYRGIPEISSNAEHIGEITSAKLKTTLRELDNLLTWPEGWNGYDALAPDYMAVQYARHWIELFYQEVITSGQEWIEPNVTASAEGEVVFEWWHGTKGLAIYVGNQHAEYLKDWGANINTEMEDGYANSPAIRRSLWKWLMSS